MIIDLREITHLSNRTGVNVRRGTPVIESIIRTDENVQKINQILASKTNSVTRNNRLRGLVGGFCTRCRGIPSKKVIYSPMEGTKLVDFYCDNCFPTDIKKLNSILVFSKCSVSK
jgi:hypothetical protein